MNVIRNIQMDLNRFRSRVVVVTFAILAAFGVLSLRLFYLQVIRYDELNAAAESNRTAIVPIVPNRGVIMDRNGVVLATNYSGIDIGYTVVGAGIGSGAVVTALDYSSTNGYVVTLSAANTDDISAKTIDSCFIFHFSLRVNEILYYMIEDLKKILGGGGLHEDENKKLLDIITKANKELKGKKVKIKIILVVKEVMIIQEKANVSIEVVKVMKKEVVVMAIEQKTEIEAETMVEEVKVKETRSLININIHQEK